MDVTSPIVQSMHDAGVMHPGDTLIMAICFAALIICFFIIACQICLAVIEYYLVVTLASVLIPFGISSHTKFIAEKAIGAAIAVSVKLMVLSFIMGLAQPLIGQMHFTGSGDITLNQMISMLLVCGLLAYVVLRAPAVAADFLSGSPSLNAGAIGQSMVSGMSSFVGAAAGAKAGGSAIYDKVSEKMSAASETLRKTSGAVGEQQAAMARAAAVPSAAAPTRRVAQGPAAPAARMAAAVTPQVPREPAAARAPRARPTLA